MLTKTALLQAPVKEPLQGKPAKGKMVRSSRARNLLTFFMVFGPGLIVMEADNDAGAVSTYTQAGAQYGIPRPCRPSAGPWTLPSIRFLTHDPSLEKLK